MAALCLTCLPLLPTPFAYSQCSPLAILFFFFLFFFISFVAKEGDTIPALCFCFIIILFTFYIYFFFFSTSLLFFSLFCLLVFIITVESDLQIQRSQLSLSLLIRVLIKHRDLMDDYSFILVMTRTRAKINCFLYSCMYIYNI